MSLGAIKFMIPELSLRNAARIAGFSYLMVFVISILGTAFALDKIIVLGDSITTANNIVANESLFRFGIACWFVVIVFDTVSLKARHCVIAAWALYFLLKPTNQNLSLLAAWFRLIFIPIFAYSFINYFSALQLLTGADYQKVFEANQLQALSMLLINTQDYAMHLSFVFFGIHIFLLGYLILRSRYMPRILGILLIVASCGYLIDSFGNFLFSSYGDNQIGFVVLVAVPAIIAEFSLTIWLLLKGGKLQEARIAI